MKDDADPRDQAGVVYKINRKHICVCMLEEQVAPQKDEGRSTKRTQSMEEQMHQLLRP